MAISLLVVVATLALLPACHRSISLDSDDPDSGPDSSTDTDSDSDSDSDSDTDTDADSDTDSDADSDTDSDTDTDTDTDTTTDSCPPVNDCENPVAVPDDPAFFEYINDWACFQEESFDSYMPGCSESDGSTVWFSVTVPLGSTLEVDKVSGATAGINLVEDCESTSCVIGQTNFITWDNPPDSTLTSYRVAVETDFAISSAEMHLSFDRF